VVSVDDPGTNEAVFLLGTLSNTEPQFNAPAAKTSLLQSFQAPDSQTFNPFLDTGSTDPEFLRQMLAHTNNSRPTLLVPSASGVTDVRVHRVMVRSAHLGVHLTQ